VTWPVGEFDELQRLRVLHAAMPGTMLAETVLQAPLNEVWTVLANVETGFPGLVPDVRSVRVVDRDGERLRVDVRGRSGLRARFDMVLRPGWCLMQSHLLVFGMAAVADGETTRFGYLAGLRVPGIGLIAPLPSRWQRRLARTTLRRFEKRFGGHRA
jgi:hypothetical protein